MPNPRAQKNASLRSTATGVYDAVTQGLLPMLGNAARGSVAATLGAPGDILGLLSDKQPLPTSQNILDYIPAAGSDKNVIGMGETMGGFVPAPGSAGLLRGVKAALNPATYRDAAVAAYGPGVVSNVIPPDVVKRMRMSTTLPDTPEFQSAVAGTPGARIAEEGLYLKLQRGQKPEQGGDYSVRTGVFYLPEGSPQAKFYKSGETGYGGTEQIKGETLVKNPLFVKGATGGKAPEEAYKQLVGKDQFKQMQDDIFKVLNSRQKDEAAYGFLEKYAPEIADNYDFIVRNSQKGNQLRYALQEAVIANEARKQGYDSVLGFSKGRGDKGNFFSELFDVREEKYPTKFGDYSLNPEFKSLLGD